MNEVRWIAQCSKKHGDGYREWRDRDDIIYSGWFFSLGNDEPSDALLSDFNEAKETYDYLDWRLVQQNRSLTTRIVA